MIKIRIERSTTLNSAPTGLAAAFAGQGEAEDEHQLVAIRTDDGDVQAVAGAAIAAFTASFPELLEGEIEAETETEILDEYQGDDDDYHVELGGQRFTAAQWDAVRNMVDKTDPGPVEEGENTPEPVTTRSFEDEAVDALDTCWRLTFADASEGLFVRAQGSNDYVGAHATYTLPDVVVVSKQLVAVLLPEKKAAF